MNWIVYYSVQEPMAREMAAAFLFEIMSSTFLASYALIMACHRVYSFGKRFSFLILSALLFGVMVFTLCWRVRLGIFDVNWAALGLILLCLSLLGLLLGKVRPTWHKRRDSPP